MVTTLEVGTTLEVAAGDGLEQAKYGQLEAEMGPDQGLEETGSWAESSWRRGHGAWIWPRDVHGGRHHELL